jgi:hypothetical protein
MGIEVEEVVRLCSYEVMRCGRPTSGQLLAM